MSDLSPLSGVKRKLDFGAVRSPFYPKRTVSHSTTRPSFVAARSQDVNLSALTLIGGGNGVSRDPIVANGACYGDASER